MQKGLGGFGALLVLGLGLGVLRNGAAPGGGAASGKPATGVQRVAEDVADRLNAGAAKCSIKPSCAEKDLFDTIASFFPEEEKGESGEALVPEFQKLINGKEIHFAIAIVPDPVHTHLSLFFDRTIDAIQQGAQQAGLIFDRATMPWDSQEHPESIDFRIRLQQEEYQRAKEDLPGLMIFRPADPEKQELNTPLFIFVVGETPTGGVNKEQFRTAIQLIHKVAKAENPLRIIGPTFSGSLYSLAQLITNELAAVPFDDIVIRSGTVSSWNTAQWFKKQKFGGRPRVEFATFQQSDRYMLRRFVEFEKRRGYEPDRMAVLSEDETAYGNLEFPTRKSSATSSPPDACASSGHLWGAAITPDEATLQQNQDCVLQLYFPRNISQLRSAYQQGLQAQAASSADSYQVRSTLPLNLQDTGSDDDTVQQYAHSQTPLSQESILLGIIAAIRQRNIKFVVLQATNPMDTVFLSGFLKKGYSEARVVAMPADLLLSRDADDVSLLHGIMALTTYPLLPAIDDEITVPDSSRLTRVGHIFPAAYSVGTYNATLSQVTCIEFPSEPGCSSPSTALPVARYAEYGWPSLSTLPASTNPLQPVVWLMALGRDGFWPVAVLEDGSYKIGTISSSAPPVTPVAPQPRQFKPPWPMFWKLLFGFVLMLAASFWMLLWKGSLLARSTAMTLLAPVSDTCRSFLIAVVAWILLAAMLLLLWPCAAWITLGNLSRWWALLAIPPLFHCIVCAKELNRRASRRGRRVFLRVAAVMFICFTLLSVLPGHSQNPFLYRYIHLTSGVSPLLPLLCLLAAGLWWAWFSLSGLSLLDRRRPRLPRDVDLPRAIPPGHTAAAITGANWPAEAWAEKLIAAARPCALSRRVYAPTLALLALALFGLDYGHPLLSLETRHFEWAYAAALAVVTLVAFGTLFRILVIWLESRRILTVLDHFPLRRAFAELNFTWEPFWRMGGARWQDLYRMVFRQLETLEHLRRELEDAGCTQEEEELVACIKATAAAQDTMRRGFAQASRVEACEAKTGSSPLMPIEQNSSPSTTSPAQSLPPLNEPQFSDFCVTSYEDLQMKIAKTCAAALKYLQPTWWEDEGLILSEVASGEDSKKDKDKDSPDLSLSTRLAERFVALVYLNFILSVILRMRTLTITVAGLYICLLLSVNSYPFEPRIALRSVAILMLIVVVGMVGYVSAQVHRDSILSLVTQTKPGELGIEFWLRMGAFVALPLFSLLVSQFPSLNNAVFSWLEPAVNALK